MMLEFLIVMVVAFSAITVHASADNSADRILVGAMGAHMATAIALLVGVGAWLFLAGSVDSFLAGADPMLWGAAASIVAAATFGWRYDGR